MVGGALCRVVNKPMEDSQLTPSAKPPEFGAIDFEEIEWRSEYSYVPETFASALAVNFLAQSVLKFGDRDWREFLGLAFVCLLFTLPRWFKRKASLLLSGHSIILRRPRLTFGLKLPGLGWLLDDIEIPYAELGEIVSREDLSLKDTSLPQQRWTAIPNRKVVEVTIYSRDGRKSIQVNEHLRNFPAFIEELKRRQQKAIERYQGYAQGTRIRQPERVQQVRETLRQQETLAATETSAEQLK